MWYNVHVGLVKTSRLARHSLAPGVFARALLVAVWDNVMGSKFSPASPTSTFRKSLSIADKCAEKLWICGIGQKWFAFLSLYSLTKTGR